MKKVLYDCDNTMGIEFRDVDDALTILYFSGHPDVDLLGITTTFGNDSIDVVYEATINLLQDLSLNDLPVHKGGTPENRISDASRFLSEQVNLYPGEITICATGALSNLSGAWLIDNDFFNKVKEVIVMGGIQEPLIINGVTCNELNFSCDPEATWHVLKSPAPTTVITGHLCLQALFGPEEFARLRSEQANLYPYLLERLEPWRDFMKKTFKIDGFFNWDVVAGVRLTNPELFDSNKIEINSGPHELQTGYLQKNTNGYKLDIPGKIEDITIFNNLVFKAWENIKMP